MQWSNYGCLTCGKRKLSKNILYRYGTTAKFKAITGFGKMSPEKAYGLSATEGSLISVNKGVAIVIVNIEDIHNSIPAKENNLIANE